VCRQVTKKNTHLGGFRCFWCSTKVCGRACLNNHETNDGKLCQYGKFRQLLIPPTSLSTNGEEDKKNWKIRSRQIGDKYPLLVFINRRSGGGLGGKFIRSFNKFINPVQIFDLAQGGPEDGLRMMFNNEINQFYIMACGGDGTAAWILSILDKINPTSYPPISVLPLGTGNDLSRTLGWGPGCDTNKEIETKYLPGLLNSHVITLDRWRLDITEQNPETLDFDVNYDPVIVNNYFSIGVDAKIALKFHTKREEHPERFSSRGMNKWFYAKYGAQAILDGCPNLKEHAKVELNGVELELPDLECIVVVNLPSCYGGAYLWDDCSKLGPLRIGDGMFELVGIINAAHCGQIQTGLGKPIVLGRGNDVKITFKDAIYPVQVDGEPWEQPPCILHVSHHNKVNVFLFNMNECHSIVKKEYEETKKE